MMAVNARMGRNKLSLFGRLTTGDVAGRQIKGPFPDVSSIENVLEMRTSTKGVRNPCHRCSLCFLSLPALDHFLLIRGQPCLSLACLGSLS